MELEDSIFGAKFDFSSSRFANQSIGLDVCHLFVEILHPFFQGGVFTSYTTGYKVHDHNVLNKRIVVFLSRDIGSQIGRQGIREHDGFHAYRFMPDPHSKVKAMNSSGTEQRNDLA